MGQASSKTEVEKAVDKGSNKATKVINQVSGNAKATTKDVKKSVNKAVADTKKAVNDALKTADEGCGKEVAAGVTLLALAAAVGYYLWKEKPWQKKSGGAAPAK